MSPWQSVFIQSPSPNSNVPTMNPRTELQPTPALRVRGLRTGPVATLLGLFVAASAWLAVGGLSARANDLPKLIESLQPKMVKIYGAGGFQGLESYQSGFLISAEGHILTIWSYVLDTSYITVHLDSGTRLKAELVGADPRLEVAVLKVEAQGLDHFELSKAVEADAGTQVLALSNLYGVATGDEPASVQHGVISVKTRLEARRGVFETPYGGPVYVIDAVTNNPGAGGGALVNRRGQLLGMLGKELRNSRDNTWLNYAVPISELEQTVTDIIDGKFVPTETADPRPKAEQPHDLGRLGIVLVPDVLARTPPFVDEVRSGSPAAQAGLRPDDLVLFVNDERLIQSCKALREELSYIDRDDPVKLTVIRGQELLEFVLQPR